MIIDSRSPSPSSTEMSASGSPSTQSDRPRATPISPVRLQCGVDGRRRADHAEGFVASARITPVWYLCAPSIGAVAIGTPAACKILVTAALAPYPQSLPSRFAMPRSRPAMRRRGDHTSTKRLRRRHALGGSAVDQIGVPMSARRYRRRGGSPPACGCAHIGMPAACLLDDRAHFPSLRPKAQIGS